MKLWHLDRDFERDWFTALQLAIHRTMAPRKVTDCIYDWGGVPTA
jgi:hypothetical protein